MSYIRVDSWLCWTWFYYLWDIMDTFLYAYFNLSDKKPFVWMLWYCFNWHHHVVLISTDLFQAWWLRLSRVMLWTGQAVCFISPLVMGKSLLHWLSPCWKYLSAAIIWHQEKVEGDSGCKVAVCGCRLKRGPTYLHWIEVFCCISKWKAFNMSNVIMWLILFDYFSSRRRRK